MLLLKGPGEVTLLPLGVEGVRSPSKSVSVQSSLTYCKSTHCEYGNFGTFGKIGRHFNAMAATVFIWYSRSL